MIVTLPFLPGVTSSVLPTSRFSSYWYSVLNGFSTTFVTGFVPILTSLSTLSLIVSVVLEVSPVPSVILVVIVTFSLPITPSLSTTWLPASRFSS